jgi:hypothetical protein
VPNNWHHNRFVGTSRSSALTERVGTDTPSAEEVARQNAVHEVGCAERWRQTNTRLSTIGVIFDNNVLFLFIGEGWVIDILKRVLGRAVQC